MSTLAIWEDLLAYLEKKLLETVEHVQSRYHHQDLNIHKHYKGLRDFDCFLCRFILDDQFH